MFHRPVLAVFLLCSWAVLVARQQPPAPPPQPLTSGATAIVIDAVVRDGKGNPVTNLRKEDFQLFEDGVQQEIGDVTSFVGVPDAAARTREGSTTGSAGAPRVPSQPSFTAIVFNRLAPEPRGRAYKGALACLETLRDGDYVGVFATDLSLITVQPYTSDRSRVRQALEAAARRAAWISAPGTLFPEEPPAASSVTGATSRTWSNIEALQQGHAATDALLAIVTGLGAAPGRKSVVFFSEGIPVPNEVLPRLKSLIATANRNSVTVYTIDAAGLRTASQEAAVGRQVRALGAAGLELTPEGANMSSVGMMESVEFALRTPHVILTLLAAETGGFLVENMNDLTNAFRQADADRRFYYLVTYAPKNSTFNGEWRAITLKVPNRRVSVRTRSGYVAVRTALTVPLLAYEGPALAALERSPAPADLPVRATALVFPDGDHSRLVVLAATDAAALRFERDDKAHTYRTDFTILARVRDARGEVVRQASQPYRLVGPDQQIAQAQRGEILFFRQPTLGAGAYTLDVAVHDALGKRAGVTRAPFVVAETSARTLQVSSLVIVQRAERVQAGERDAENPLYAGDLLVYPNLGEPLRKSRDKSVTLYVALTPAPGEAPRATLDVLRDAQTLMQSPAPLTAADASGRIAHLGQLALDTLAPGRYTIRLTVTQGDRREVRDAAFQLID